VNADQQLLHETRVRNRMAIVAVLGGLLLVAASAIQLAGPHTSVDELTLDLIIANKRFPLDLIASVVNAVASLLVAWTLVFLHQCAQARSPETVKPFIKIIAIVAGVLSAVTGVVYAIVVATKVHQFVSTGAQTYEEAKHLTGGSTLVILQLAGQLAALLLAVSFVLVSLSALRVGLLTRFMAYLGMFAGVLVLFQIIQIPVVQGYWLAALGYLFSGRWPSGVPPAWRSGRAEPWPSSAEMRARRAGAAAGGAAGGLGGGRRARAPKPEPQPAGAPAPPNPGRSRANTSKRKRKRRN
jgi:hypothetical protein